MKGLRGQTCFALLKKVPAFDAILRPVSEAPVFSRKNKSITDMMNITKVKTCVNVSNVRYTDLLSKVKLIDNTNPP